MQIACSGPPPHPILQIPAHLVQHCELHFSARASRVEGMATRPETSMAVETRRVNFIFFKTLLAVVICVGERYGQDSGQESFLNTSKLEHLVFYIKRSGQEVNVPSDRVDDYKRP
jgi:hypothetical protein